MVKVYDKIKVRYGGRCVELTALFDTGAGGSYLSDEVAEKIGYKPYPEPRRIPLAVKGHEAEVIGYVPEAELEIAGHVLPELESLGVIRGLYVEAIIGRNLIEKYGITLEEGRIGFREVPPRASLLTVVGREPIPGFQCPKCGSYSVIREEYTSEESYCVFTIEEGFRRDGPYAVKRRRLRCLKCGWTYDLGEVE